MPHSHALCMTRAGDRFFPTDTVFVSEASVNRCTNGQGRTLLADEHGSRPTVEEAARGSSGSSGSSVRAAHAALHAGVGAAAAAATHNDVSLCDVLDTNLDVVYDPVDNRLYATDLQDTAWLYMTISALILVVVVLTAETVSQRERSSLTHNIVAWVLLTGCSLLMLLRVDGRMHPFVTVEDHTFMMLCCCYVVASTLFWVVTSQFHSYSVARVEAEVHTDAATGPNTQRDGINAMIGSVHLATSVLYGTPDNTYVSAFFFVFLFRCMQKLHDAHAHPDAWTVCANTMLVIDFTYTALVFTYGVLPHYGHDNETVLFAAAQYVICDTVAANCVISAAAAALEAAAPPQPADSKNGNSTVAKAPDFNPPNIYATGE
jgi:hypothetical protein